MDRIQAWWIFAVLSAFFAALTICEAVSFKTVFAKVGVENVSSNLATAIRTVVILAIAWGLVYAEGTSTELFELNLKTLLFLVLSGMALGGFPDLSKLLNSKSIDNFDCQIGNIFVSTNTV